MSSAVSATPRQVVEPLLKRCRMTETQEAEFWRRFSKAMYLELTVYRELLEGEKS